MNKKKSMDRKSKAASVVNKDNAKISTHSGNAKMKSEENDVKTESLNEGTNGQSKLKKNRTADENLRQEENHTFLQEAEEETIVDKSLAIVQGAWKLWTWVGLLALILGILSYLEVEETEVLIVEKGVALAKTRANVFQFVGNLKNFNQWYPGIRAFDPTDSTPMGIGKHFTEVVDVPIYGTFEYDNAVVGYESPRYISFVSDSYWMLRTEMEITRRECDKAPTLLTFRVYSRCRSYFFRYVVSNVLSLMHGGRIRQALFNLKFVFQK